MNEQRAALLRLASLPSMSPRCLRKLLGVHTIDELTERLTRGAPLHPLLRDSVYESTWSKLQAQLPHADLDAVIERCARADVAIVSELDPEYPLPLRHDPDPPAVLYVRGSLQHLQRRRVAIVGTRNATAAGRATATELGTELAIAGVTVVSGLARGIDAAAHRGVRAAGTTARGGAVAVVGNGLDVPYPRQNTDLWNWVAEHGALISEWQPGTIAEPWRFPLRNRVIAGLSERVIVVESRDRGGSLITVRCATDRGIDVMAVPGSVRSRASEGTNALLDDGAAIVRTVDDVLVALGLDHSKATPPPVLEHVTDPVDSAVLAACLECSCTFDMLARFVAAPLSSLAASVRRLEDAGLVLDSNGWYEASGSRLVRLHGGESQIDRSTSLPT